MIFVIISSAHIKQWQTVNKTNAFCYFCKPSCVVANDVNTDLANFKKIIYLLSYVSCQAAVTARHDGPSMSAVSVGL